MHHVFLELCSIVCTPALVVIMAFHKGKYHYPRSPIEKWSYVHANPHAGGLLGDTAFEMEFADRRKLSLEEGLDLALKIVEEM
jgi:hypothetical protein